MLVLARMRDESIMIGDDVEVTVVDIRGDMVPAWGSSRREPLAYTVRKFTTRFMMRIATPPNFSRPMCRIWARNRLRGSTT